MMEKFPLKFTLDDGTRVEVYKQEEDCFEFILKRLNSEEHNFLLDKGRIKESYETRFDKWQNEAVDKFRQMQLQNHL